MSHVSSMPIEEETLPSYSPHRYLPVRLGDIYNDQYKIISKLGFGGESTVWLAKDIRQRWFFQSERFVTLKILVNDLTQGSLIESKVSQLVKKKRTGHEGRRYIRTVEESFVVTGPDGEHVFLVYETMRESLSIFQRKMVGGVLPANFLKPLLVCLLQGLDFLHRECGVIHTDLKPDNILLGLENSIPLTDLVKEEQTNPTPFKEMQDGRRIYAHRNFGAFRGVPGRPKISDFGLAVTTPGPHFHPIQPVLFHAPEVILGAGWGFSADIWNLGVLLWDLLENQTLFNATDPATEEYSSKTHLSEMISLLGPPPQNLLSRCRDRDEYFTPEGESRYELGGLRKGVSLEDTITNVFGEDKEMFLVFVRRMLKWDSEERASAKELLEDPWLYSSFEK